MTSNDAAAISTDPPRPVLLGLQGLQVPRLSAYALHPWIAALVGFHALAVLVAASSMLFVKVRLDALAGSSIAISRQTTELVAQVDDLSAQSRAIKAEGAELRQYVASSSAEQVIFLKILVLRPDIDVQLARSIARHARRYATLYKRDADLVLAIIAEESRFDPNAVSPMGAVGLMQVMPQWEKVLGISGSLKDPEVSIKYGLQVLGFYLEMYKDTEMALTAYNRGPGPVDMALMRGKDPKNRYAPQVLKVYERLKRLGVSRASEEG